MDITEVIDWSQPPGTAKNPVMPGEWQYFINGHRISAFEHMQLAHMNNVEATLKSILKELRKLNAAPKRKKAPDHR